MFANEEVLDLSQPKEQEQDKVSASVDNDNQQQYNVSSEESTQEVDPFVERAAKEGWVPKEQFRGDQSRWVDAKTYVERGEIMRPLKDEITRLKREMTEKERNMIAAMNDIQRLAKEDADRKIAEYEARKKAAFEAGDYNTFSAVDKAQREIEQRTAQQPQQPSQQNVEAYRAAEEFKAANAWFERDAERTEQVRQFVASEMERAKMEGRYVSPYDFRGMLNYAAQQFGPQAPQPKQQVASATNRPAPTQQKRFSDLSQEDKKTFDALYRRGVFKRAKSIGDAQESYAREILNESPFIGR